MKENNLKDELEELKIEQNKKGECIPLIISIIALIVAIYK